MFNSETTKLSFYNRTTNPTPTQSLSLYEVYRLIVGEGKDNKLKGLTESLRAISDPDPKQEKNLKRDFKRDNFPAISFGGEFSKRSNSGLTKSSNLVCLDFDHIGTGEELELIKQRVSLTGDLDPVLLFISPSGDGLKVVVNVRQEITDDEGFKEAFKSLRRFCQEVLQLDPDEQRKDISGLCYLPYDGEAILRQVGKGFDVEKWRPVEAPKPQVAPVRQTPVRTTNFGSEPTDYDRALLAVEDIENSGVSLTDSRNEWRDIGFALSNLGEAGRDLFHRLSRMSAYYDPEGTEKFFSEALNSRRGGINLETLFYSASQHGIRMRSSNYRNTAQDFVQRHLPKENPTESFTAPQEAEIVPQPTQGQTQDFGWLLEPTTEKDIRDRMSKLPEGLLTGYAIKGPQGHPQKLRLLSGKLIEVAGATGHGKTLFLMNLLLNVARKYPEKRFVLFTYEENSDTILSYLLNIYLNDLNLMKPNEGTSNRLLLEEYFRTGETNSFNPKSVPEFLRRKDLFFRHYIETGRILVKYVESDSQTLCRQIEFLSHQTSVGAVFVDYFQYINPDPQKRFPTRQEALKSICIELKDVANRTGLPVVLACQFNQEVLSPTDVLLTKIGEAGDISRIGAECWGLWQMGKDIGRKLENSDKSKFETLKQQSDTMSLEDGFVKGMYIRILKSRIVETGSEDMFRFRGLTGKLSVNDPDEQEGLSVEDWNKPDPVLPMDDDLPEFV